MRFPVPQFIDVEDHIFGSLTFKQAVFLAGAGALFIALFSRLGFFWAILFGSPVIVLALLLAFYKVNNRPFMEVLYSWFSFTVNKKLYLWKKEQKKNENQKKEEVGEASARPITPKVSQSRLKELAWTLDTRESLYEREGEWH